MKPSYFGSAVGLLTVLLLVPLAAAQPAASPAAAPQPGGQPMVLLLEDFQILEGTVQRVGGMYHLRRGSELRQIPEKRVLFAGDSRDAVQRYLRARGASSVAPPPTRPTGGLNSAAVRAFAGRVQPVLTNLCANCHARPDHAGEFKLSRVVPDYPNPEAIARNADAVARFVRPDDPSASPLLTQTITAHGGQRLPALPGRWHPAFRNLELWVHWAAAVEGAPMPEVVPPPPRKPTTVRPATPPPPAPAAPREDPFDPDVFNRAMHPSR